MTKYSAEELNSFSKEQLISMFISNQELMEKMNDNLEKLIEQIRIADQNRFGRRTERLDEIAGQMSLFNEAEAYADDSAAEPDGDEVIMSVQAVQKKKKSGKRAEDFKDLPHEPHLHKLTDEQLDAFFGKGCWRRLKPEEFTRVRCQPAAYTVEDHCVDVAVGISGDHQDEFLRGDRPNDLLRGSVATPSLVAAILNAKYMNAQPLYRIENQFRINGVNLSRQTMANWVIRVSEKYLSPLWERFCEELLKEDVTQADETTVQVIHDNDPSDPGDRKSPAGHKNYMWVHRSGEFCGDHPIVVFEYQRTRHHIYPLRFYNGYKGVLVTDGLQQYSILEKKIDSLTNASCWAHARRDYADAVKAIGKGNAEAIKSSYAAQALARIGAIYKVEEGLKHMAPEERLAERQKSVKPLVDEYFAWIKARLADVSALPKGKTAEGMRYSINHEDSLRVFLGNGNVPIDNSACERSIRPFTTGRKNWVLINSIKGAQASAVAYTIVETAKLNGLNPYYYLEHLLTELPRLADKDGNIDTAALEPLLPWAEELPEKCHKPRR